MPRLPMMPALQNSTSIGAPFSFAASRATWSRLVTSSGYSALAPRAVPMTRQPSSAYCRASSWPRPLPAPVMRIVGMRVPEVDGEVGRRRPRRHLVEEIGDEAAVLAGVDDEVRENLHPRHPTVAAADEGEWDHLVELRRCHALAPGDGPRVHLLLSAPELFQRRVVLRVARAIAVIATFEMRLEDAIDDVVMVERVDHVLEQRLPRLGRFARGQRSDGVEDQLVRPSVVAREHLRLAAHPVTSATAKPS